MPKVNIQLIDVGKNKKLKEYIKQQKESNFNLFSNNKEAFLIIDRHGHIRHGNVWCSRMAGYSQEELLKKSIYDLVPQEDMSLKPFFSEDIEQFAADFYIRGVRAPLQISFITIPIFHNDELIGKYMVLKERKKDQESERSDTPYNQLIDHSPYGIVLIKNELIMDINMMGKKMIGIEEKREVIGKDSCSLIPGSLREEFINRIRSIQSGDQIEPWKQKIVKANGLITEIDLQASLICYKHEDMIQLIMKELDGERSVTDLSLYIATGLAHELKTPLIRIEGFMELMRVLTKNEDIYYEIIKEDVQRLKDIIKDVLITDYRL
ncbi:PAS domain S-box protein [Pullulanibacillus sp. KACC 23026]|uniref:PAS domain S-box protein n=1 Tax=Pullulanibacillus sp. KACC 23026 TaxID=3028315 RepID=UPI0023AEF7C7|nr:PAS domain S-box protein [Pullulanibacillus sp. KACC 23026]WEG12873.1 PAS domain S-box protein [Pullulanibacillus sp. KACC 23026]